MPRGRGRAQQNGNHRDKCAPPLWMPALVDRGTPFAHYRAMGESLKRRIRDHGRRDRRDAFFADRLHDAVLRIEQEFHGDHRSRLLALASATFDRHLELRDHTQRTRERIERLKEDQRMLSELFARLVPRSRGERIH